MERRAASPRAERAGGRSYAPFPRIATILVVPSGLRPLRARLAVRRATSPPNSLRPDQQPVKKLALPPQTAGQKCPQPIILAETVIALLPLTKNADCQMRLVSNCCQASNAPSLGKTTKRHLLVGSRQSPTSWMRTTWFGRDHVVFGVPCSCRRELGFRARA